MNKTGDSSLLGYDTMQIGIGTRVSEDSKDYPEVNAADSYMHWYLYTNSYGITSQKTGTFNNTAVRTSNLADQKQALLDTFEGLTAED